MQQKWNWMFSSKGTQNQCSYPICPKEESTVAAGTGGIQDIFRAIQGLAGRTGMTEAKKKQIISSVQCHVKWNGLKGWNPTILVIQYTVRALWESPLRRQRSLSVRRNRPSGCLTVCQCCCCRHIIDEGSKSWNKNGFAHQKKRRSGDLLGVWWETGLSLSGKLTDFLGLFFSIFSIWVFEI